MNKAAVGILIQVNLGMCFSWTLMYYSRNPNYTSFTAKGTDADIYI